MKKRVVTRLGVLLLVVASSLAFAGSAEASLNNTLTTLRSVATGYCVDSNQTGAMYGLSCNGGPYQQWWHWTPTNTWDRLLNNATSRCVDSDSTGHAYTLGCNGGPYQEWIFTYKFNGYEIRSVATGWCLDGNAGGSIYTQPCNGGNYQRWNIA
jgi:hypothetical protein